jgi:hypothetical protein
MADLSETTVVLPNNAGVAEISAYLGILGRLSDSTGYPATGVTVARADQTVALENKDIILIGSGDNQPLLTQWAKQSPANMGGATRRVNLSDLVYKAWNWVVPHTPDTADRTRGDMAFTTDGASVVFAGFESPVSSGRSVVAISSSRPEGMDEAINALISTDETVVMQGNVAAVRGTNVESLVTEKTYYVGNLGPLRWLQWQIWSHPALMLLFVALGIALLSIPLYFALRARARQRLNP